MPIFPVQHGSGEHGQRAWLARGLQLARSGFPVEARAAAQELMSLGVSEPGVRQGFPDLLMAVGLYDQARLPGGAAALRHVPPLSLRLAFGAPRRAGRRERPLANAPQPRRASLSGRAARKFHALQAGAASRRLLAVCNLSEGDFAAAARWAASESYG